MSRTTAAAAYLRKNGANIGIEALVNFVGPFVIYQLTKAQLGDVRALMASSAPPILWSLIGFARHRRVDAVSMLVLGGIALSLLAYLGGGGVKLLQLREKLVNALIGTIFLGSAAIGRPLIYQLARATIRRRSADEAASFEAMQANAGFRRSMMVMTVVWGAGLLLESAVGVVLVYTLSIRDYLLASPVVGYSTVGALTAWTFWYMRRRRAAGASALAAQAEVAKSNAPPA